MAFSVIWWIIVVLAMVQGVIMLIRPRVYVRFCNGWYSLLGHERRLSAERFERWPNRLGGLAMLLTGAYLVWVMIR
jgi:hypothetical protein